MQILQCPQTCSAVRVTGRSRVVSRSSQAALGPDEQTQEEEKRSLFFHLKVVPWLSVAIRQGDLSMTCRLYRAMQIFFMFSTQFCLYNSFIFIKIFLF